MSKFQIPSSARFIAETGQNAIKQAVFDKFNPSVLGLGQLTNESVTKGAICAVFDLQGFTVFCKQVEPHLSVPIFLNDFLHWIFEAIRKETIEKQLSDGVALWHDLPFYVKYLGDGLLVLWDTNGMSLTAQHNLILSCLSITKKYVKDFMPVMRKKTSDTPPILRCGMAKGNVFSVGNGDDYVGSCINIASRLQKMNGLTFAFARRGFDPEGRFKDKGNNWILKKVEIRGIGDGELIYIRLNEFQGMHMNDQAAYVDP
jgi:hypothetical protein